MPREDVCVRASRPVRRVPRAASGPPSCVNGDVAAAGGAAGRDLKQEPHKFCAHHILSMVRALRRVLAAVLDSPAYSVDDTPLTVRTRAARARNNSPARRAIA